jgi:NADPH2:quinone reductase
MHAIQVRQFGPSHVLQTSDIPVPTPGSGQIRVAIHAAGVNPLDTYIRSGAYSKLPPLPYTPGFDGAGVVDSVGAEVHGFALGQRVYVSGSLTGTYAQFALCAPSQVHPLPEPLSFAQGAALGIPYATADFALRSRGRAASGELLLIHGGTGAVGSAALQIARSIGMRVLVTGGTEAGRKLALDNGAEAVFDHTLDNYEAGLLSATQGLGFHLVLEMLANVNLARDLRLVAHSGRIVVVGSRGPAEIQPRELMLRNADILGVMLLNAPQEELRKIHERLQKGALQGHVKPVISQFFPLALAHQAHDRILQNGVNGKLVLLPWESAQQG